MNLPGPSQRLDAAEPQSVPVFVAAVSEPLLAVACLLAATVWLGEPVDRAVTVLAILLLVLVFPGTNRFFERPLDAGVDILSAWAIVLGILALAGFATDSFRYFEPAVLLTWAVATPLAQFALVLGGRALLRVQARQPETRRPALIVGAGPVGAKVAAALRERRAYGHDLVGFLEDRSVERLHPATAGQVIGRFDQLAACIRTHRVKDVYITLPLSSQPRIARLLAALQDSAVSIFYVPDVFGVRVIQGRIRTLDGVPVVSLLESPFVGIHALVKRASDLVLASLILMLAAPLMLAIAVAIRLDSPGPVIVRQRRNGLDGEEIVVYKFRSLHAQEDARMPRPARRGDPRITRVGALLRRTSLDQLPQFINVLQGRMSVVGPRPHAVAHNEQYRPIIRSYMVRHKVKPGITGWAQVNGFRGETEVIEKMAGRVAYDIDYLRNWSLGLDLRIIARTLRLVIFDR
jgi:putative colanic acid biosynthesis UDP-glucose lipid carrier transferase